MARQKRQIEPVPDQTAHADTVKVRREWVARLSAAGLSSREIEAKLAKLKPAIIADHSTICRDLNELRPLLLEAVGARPLDHMARQFAELQEAKRQSWEDHDLRALVRFMVLEVRLLGTAAPTRFDIDGRIDYGIFSDDQLTRIKQGANPLAVLAETVSELNDKGEIIRAAKQELERRRALNEQGDKQA